MDVSMNIEQLTSLAKQGESHTLEFKKSTTQIQAAFETVCAFLNGDGGTVLIGVTDDGRIVGQDIADNTRLSIANEIKKIQPSEKITIEYAPLSNNKQVIVISVLPGLHAPYTYDGRPYQRDLSQTNRMSQPFYDRLVATRLQLNFSWERLKTDGYTIADLDHDRILGMVRKGVEVRRIPEDALRQEMPKLLESLKLLTDGQLNNAAVALFAKEISSAYLQCQLKVARFKGEDRRDFLDSDRIYGNVFDLLDRGMLFISRHLPLAAKVEPGKLERVETPLIPFDAIREALINSLCHRDYSEKGGSIGLAIYENEMEIFNNGGLQPNVTIEKIKSGFSKLRNPLMADIFYKCQLVETWGSGVPAIINLCKKAHDPEPEFKADELEFKVVFKFPSTIKPPVVFDQENISINHSVTQRQREIVEILMGAQELKMKEILQKLKVPPAERTLRDDLAVLKKFGLVDSRGHARTAVWFYTGKKN
jgi:ATP-dependent DNA helicase RecG